MNTPDFDYDSIPVGYYDEIFKRQRGMQSKWHHLKFARVRRELRAGTRHLDVACGPGTFIGTLPATMRSVGVDISSPQVDYARTHHGTSAHTFGHMVPGRLPFANSDFAVITCLELIEHIPAAAASQLMKECLRVLRPGGRVVFTTPNYGGFWPLLEFFLNRFGKVSYRDQHITRYTKRKLSDAIASSGFTNVEVKTCLFAAPFTAVLSWRMADFVSSVEDPLIANWAGHLLLATAEKP